jgi:integral membrane sensor domain MASE1
VAAADLRRPAAQVIRPCKRPPEGGLSLSQGDAYFEAALAADIAAVAADEAASAAEEAAAIDDVAAVVSAGAGVTTTAGAVAGVVVVVVVSSFFVQAAKETAAARVTINNAVFIFLLDLGFGTMTGQLWEPSHEEPHRSKTRKAKAIQCLTLDYRRLKGVP